MAQLVDLSTITQIVVGPTTTITVLYDGSIPDELPDTLSAAIADIAGIINGSPYKEGDLLITVKNYPDHIIYELDANGNLILILTTGDGDKYNLDNLTGELTYTKITA